MGDFLRYDHFNYLDTPAVAVDKEGRVIYRNQAALNLSQRFRMGSGLLSFFEDEERFDACLRKRTLSLLRLQLSKDAVRSVLLIPDRSPEGMQAILLLAPTLEGDFCYAPSRTAASGLNNRALGAPALPEAKDLTLLGRALINAYARLPRALYDETGLTENITVSSACMLLNRLFEQIFAARKPAAQAKCQPDCLYYQLDQFQYLAACLAYLAVLLAVNARGDKLTVIFQSAENHPLICFSFSDRAPHAESLTDLIPGRAVEFTLLEALLDRLSYDMRVLHAGGEIIVELTCRKRFPRRRFKAPDENARMLEVMLVARLLSELLGEIA